MSTFDIGVPVPRSTGTHLPLARRQLVRNRDRQIQSVHDRTARRPYRYSSITQRAASPLACNLNGVPTAPLRGTVSIVAVCDVTPAGRFSTSSLTSPLKSFNEA